MPNPKRALSVVHTIEDDLADLLTNKNEPLLVRCSVQLALKELPESTVALLNTAFADPGVKGSRIAVVLQKHGHQVRQNAVQRHRRGECRCTPPA